jgi:hypothetical protein
MFIPRFIKIHVDSKPIWEEVHMPDKKPFAYLSFEIRKVG